MKYIHLLSFWPTVNQDLGMSKLTFFQSLIFERLLPENQWLKLFRQKFKLLHTPLKTNKKSEKKIQGWIFMIQFPFEMAWILPLWFWGFWDSLAPHFLGKYITTPGSLQLVTSTCDWSPPMPKPKATTVLVVLGGLVRLGNRKWDIIWTILICIYIYICTWWFQHIWKIWYSQTGSFPQVGMKISKNWNHHPDIRI